MAGTSLCFLAVCSFFSFPGQNVGGHAELPIKLGEEVHRENRWCLSRANGLAMAQKVSCL